eukprot:19057-Heterococcus_DN1.PRE.3
MIFAHTATAVDCVHYRRWLQQVLFDAVIVTRASAEGRIMKKWLDAARRKMGGLHLFPKDGAKYVLQIPYGTQCADIATCASTSAHKSIIDD